METVKTLSQGAYSVRISEQLNEFTGKLEYYTMNLQNNGETVSPVQKRDAFKTLNGATKYANKYLSNK